MRALIIDDEQYVRLVLEHTLREEGCDVVVASDGKAGIAALQSETFDCVITDLRMPGIDGFETCRRLKQQQWSDNAVFIAYTGLSAPRSAAAAAGFDHIVLKGDPPYVFETVLNDLAGNG